MEEYIDTLCVFQKSVQSLSAGGGKERAEHSQWRENKERCINSLGAILRQDVNMP